MNSLFSRIGKQWSFRCLLRKASLAPFLPFLCVLLLAAPAQAAITYFNSASNPSDAGSNGTSPVAVTPPGSMLAGDLVVLVANTRDNGRILAIINNGGQSWTAETANSSNVSQRIFWARYVGSWTANPSVAFSGGDAKTVSMHVFRPSSSSSLWALDVAQVNGAFAKPATSPYDITIAGITTVTDGSLVFASWASTDNNAWSLQTAGWTNAGSAQYRNNNGNDSSQSSAYKIMPTAGPSGDVVNQETGSAGTDKGNTLILAFKEIPFNHVRILHDGAATDCETESVTIQACANAACTTNYTGGVSGTVSVTNGSSSVPFTISSGSSSTTASLAAAAGTQILSGASTSPSATTARCFNGASETCSMVYSACPSGTCDSGSIAGVINTYYPITASLSAGDTTFTVGTSSGAATALARNDLVLIMQMQDAAIDTTNTASYGTASAINAGKYEYAVVSALVGSTVTLSSGLTNSYTYQAGSGVAAQKTIQLVRVPVYSTASLGAGVTASAWNGATGGVLAFDVTGALNLNSATVNASGKGFRGGGGRQLGGGSGSSADYRTLATNVANGSKGEGIAGTPRYVNNAGVLLDTTVEGYPSGSYAKGAPANAGGGGTDDNPPANNENTGGGGGANAGAGGMGGFGWNAPASPGRGIGGAAVTSSASKFVLGGGGGAASTNDGTGTPGSGFASSGAAGGGIIMARAGSLTGNGTFNVSGTNANNTVLNDGSGGGGAAGAVMVLAGSGMGGLTVTANGGAGGTNTGGGSDHGPGGGGGGGYVLSSATLAACSVAGGANGVTFSSHTFGATAGSVGSCATTLTSAQVVGAALGQGPCATSGPHHLEIQHGSGAGVTCTPSTLTIQACADALATCTPYTGGVSGTLSATGTPTVNWAGGSGAFTIAAGNSTVTKNVQLTTAGTAVLDATSTPAASSATTCNFGSPSCTFTSALAGFIFDVPNHVADTLQTVNVSAVKQSDSSLACVPAFATTSKTVSFACSYTNPSSGTLPVAVNGTNIACGTAGNVSLAFNVSGVASTTFRYADVGNIGLTATYTGSGGTEAGLTMTGSDSFIAAPASFTVVPSGPYIAGVAFSATVTAKNASGNTTPNFGKETTAAGVTMTRTLTGPVGGAAGSLTGSVSSFGTPTAGVGTGSNLIFTEVGDISLIATNTNYLGSGIDATGSGATGPFKPAYFDTAVTPGTNTFTYSGQPFTVTVTAKNALGATTVNYAGSYAKPVTLSDASAGTNNSGTLGSFANASIPAASFTTAAAGVASTSTIAYTFTARSTAPLTLAMRAVDADGVSSSGHAEGTTEIRSGRVRMANAYGSERLVLPVLAQAEYYTAAGWILNAADTGLTATPLSAAPTVTPTGGIITAANCPPPTACTTSSRFSGGILDLRMTAPNAAGYADVTLDVPTWLEYPWHSAVAGDPTSRVTFGIYKGNDRIIYRRERY